MGSTAASNASPMTTPKKKPTTAAQISNSLLSSPILQADELCLNPRWSPHLKSPPPNTTLSARLRLQNSPMRSGGRPQSPFKSALDPLNAQDSFLLDDDDDDDAEDLRKPVPADHSDALCGPNLLTSPLSKRARILQSGSPESLPPLSPVVSNRKRTFRGEPGPDGQHPFSPTASGLRIRYSPSSPMSPTLRVTPRSTDPESPTLSQMLVKDSPALTLDEKLGGAIEDESPTLLQMSRSLLFRLDLQSPSTRREGSAMSDDCSADPTNSAARATDKDKSTSHLSSTTLLTRQQQHSPLGSPVDEDMAMTMAPSHMGDDSSIKRKQPVTLRRPISSGRVNLTSNVLEQKRRKLIAEQKTQVLVPQFFVSPLCPRTDSKTELETLQQLQKVRRHFDCNFGAQELDFSKVTEDCGLPTFANRALFRYVTRDCHQSTALPGSAGSASNGKRSRFVDKECWPTYKHFCNVWTHLRRSSLDIHALLFNILVDDPTKPRAYLTRDDLRPIVTDVVDHHYELEFLEGDGMSQFAHSYTETVIERIFYVANRTWDGKLTLAQFRRANIVGAIKDLEIGIDVNIDTPGLFSYKHFYVLFCSFFELNINRDGLLLARDLMRYFNNALSRRIISRIMLGKGKPAEMSAKKQETAAAVARAKAKAEKRRKEQGNFYSRYDLNVHISTCRMSYRDYIWFLLSEIDKTSPTAIEYWFRCLDLDGDGVLTVYELEYFYEEQACRMVEEVAGDMIMLDDLMCQLTDMVRPEKEGMFTLKDLRRAPASQMPLFFDAFMNLPRFLDHESRTSYLQKQLAQLSQRALPKMSFKAVVQMRMDFLASLPNPWDEFADMEYHALLNEQGDYKNTGVAEGDRVPVAASSEVGTAGIAA
ncbi:Serine/threonine-protein phosphatase 2A regulatory subunit B'' subunit alpha [Coemansia sp. Benny D115]|nr:Serine/threonine-protein phosphatase 2A regulatory subunit B'' subunit alpha [Coemansia sp. Benny D115]